MCEKNTQAAQIVPHCSVFDLVARKKSDRSRKTHRSVGVCCHEIHLLPVNLLAKPVVNKMDWQTGIWRLAKLLLVVACTCASEPDVSTSV